MTTMVSEQDILDVYQAMRRAPAQGVRSTVLNRQPFSADVDKVYARGIIGEYIITARGTLAIQMEFLRHGVPVAAEWLGEMIRATVRQQFPGEEELFRVYYAPEPASPNALWRLERDWVTASCTFNTEEDVPRLLDAIYATYKAR